jgi:Putative transposase
VLKYLARYTHRAAISNHRLIGIEGDQVEFLWKDYARGGKQKAMKLQAVEFLRRFLMHILPTGFMRIRHYGFLANRVCREKLELCRSLLGAIASSVAAQPITEPNPVSPTRPEGHICPACGEGRMVIIETLTPTPGDRRGQACREPAPELVGCDTS